MSLFHGPVRLIEKRHDKLLDYEAATVKLEKNRRDTSAKDTTKVSEYTVSSYLKRRLLNF